MKIRTGFVSNSSSSSFVIGMAKVNKNCVKDLITLCKEYNMDWDTEIKFFKGDTIKVTSFMYNEISMGKNQLDIGDVVFSIDICGNEGDDYFYNGNDDIDYSSYDYDNLPTNIKEFLDKAAQYFDDSIVLDVGAGRNG